MQHKILIVDDEADLREILVEMLSDEEFECLEAEDGLQALNMIKESQFSFIISDVRMPNMTGIELTEEVRKLDPVNPPILLISGYSDVKDSNHAKQLGAVGLYSKPYDCAEIIKAIREHLD